MSKTLKLAVTLYLIFILAVVVNIRFRLVQLTWISIGRLIVGEVGYADGIQLLVLLLIDLIVYGIFFFVLATVMQAALKSLQRLR